MKQEQIDRIMEEFDFERMHEFMVPTNWCWLRGNVRHVPSIPELHKEARSLLTQFWDESLSLSSGGFVVRPYGDSEYELSFEVTSSSSCLEKM